MKKPTPNMETTWNFRLPKALKKAAERKAKGKKLHPAEWLRRQLQRWTK